MQGWCGGQQPTKAGRAAHSPRVQSTTAATDTSRAKGLGSWAAPNHEPGVVSVTHTHQSTGNGFHYRNVSKINFLKAFCSQNKLKWKKKKKKETPCSSMAQDHVLIGTFILRERDSVLCQPALSSMQHLSTWKAPVPQGRNQEKQNSQHKCCIKSQCSYRQLLLFGGGCFVCVFCVSIWFICLFVCF